MEASGNSTGPVPLFLLLALGLLLGECPRASHSGWNNKESERAAIMRHGVGICCTGKGRARPCEVRPVPSGASCGAVFRKQQHRWNRHGWQYNRQVGAYRHHIPMT